jgi:uncharacterized protein with NRDE domain
VCTASVVPLEDGFRLAFNRDERRDRPTALAPAIQHLQHRVAVFPIDPLGGGTWIGVNDLGLAAALLNRTTTPRVPTDPLRPSRGQIIPALLDCQSLTEALDVCLALEPSRFNLFRLLLIQDAHGVVATSSDNGLSTDHIELERPWMLTSSSLGDSVVEAPRRQLFEQVFADDGESWGHAQARFHSHRWLDRPEISVAMSRPDAKTVSRAWVTVSSSTIQFRYRSFNGSSNRIAAA